MALQVEHRIEHQLPRAVVGHFTAPINPKERCRGVFRIKAQEGRIRAAAQGLAGLVLEQQHRLRPIGVLQQPPLQLLLPTPALGKGDAARGLETDCVVSGRGRG